MTTYTDSKQGERAASAATGTESLTDTVPTLANGCPGCPLEGKLGHQLRLEVLPVAVATEGSTAQAASPCESVRCNGHGRSNGLGCCRIFATFDSDSRGNGRKVRRKATGGCQIRSIPSHVALP